MALQYNSENDSWSWWLKDIKSGFADASKEAGNFFTRYESRGKNLTQILSNVSNNNGLDNFVKQNKLADESLIKFLGDTNYAEKTLDNYKVYLKDTGQATSAFTKFTKKAGSALKSFGAAMASMAAQWLIMEIIGYIASIPQRIEEAHQKIIDLGKEAAETSKQLNELIEQYRKLGEDGQIDLSDQETARGIQEQINELLGEQATNINLVNGKYEDQLELLKKIHLQNAEDSRATKLNAKTEAENHLDFWHSSKMISGSTAQPSKDMLAKALKEFGIIEDNKHEIAGSVINFKSSSAEETVDMYNELIDLQSFLVDGYEEEIKEGGKLYNFYKDLSSKIEKMKTDIEDYKTAISDYNINEAVIQFNKTDFGGFKGALIDTEEQMTSWLDAMFNSNLSDGIKQELVGLAKTYYPDLTDAINDSTEAYIQNQLAQVTSDSFTGSFISTLNSLAKQSGLTEQEIHNLTLECGIFNNQNLSVDDKIAALQLLGYNAQWAGLQIANIGKKTVLGQDYIVAYDKDGKLQGIESVKKFEVSTPPTSSSPSSSPKSGSKSSSSDADKAEKEALEKFKEGLETREKLLERYKKAVDLTDFGLDLSEENDFALRADLLNNKMSQLTSYGLAMREEFDRVASIIPKTGEEAEALASHLESLGSDMRDNIKNLRETQVAMEQLKIDSIASIGDYYLGDLENELSNIEKRIELLNKDNKKDYKYTNKILQMEMFLPTASSTTGAQNRRRQADQEIINDEQATQDVLNDMFEEQIKKNDKLREEERQALLDDMETMRQDVVLKLESVNKDYDSSWKTAQDTTNTGIANIENSLNNMDMTIPAPDISAVVTACEQVKDMLDHMGDADYSPPKLRISDGIDGGDANSIIRGNKPNIVSNVAKNQLGVPYVWGGIAPGEGLDCSGLTQYAYGVAGVPLPRRSQEQWSCGMGTRIDWKDLKKGDQLFFGSNGEATHTGIYVGNGQMIHAPHTGDVVKYSSIDSEYYQSNFLGAKRYAVGTPKGNAQASRFGIAGENFKPEILIDKITGETRYIDKPTLIDITKTDVVGEKATANLPKFATGTPMANEKYLKEIKEACEAFNVPYNIALSLIDQESANGTASDTWRKNSAGAVGLTQITASALGDFRETQHQVTRDILAKLSENNVNFENSRTESESAYRDNIWTGIANLRLLNDRYFNGDDSTWKKTLGWYYAGGAYNGSKGQWYANQVTNRANSQPFVDVAKALGDNTIVLEANTEAIEETDANKLKIKEIQDDVNSTAKEIDESVSSTRVQQIQILNDDSLSDREKTFELLDIYNPAADKAAEIGYEAWNSLYNEFMNWWQKTETGEEIFNQEIFDAYVDGLSEIKEGVIDVEENAVGLKETIVGYMEDDLSKIDQYIEDRNFFGDWELFGDSEPEAIKRQIETITEAYKRNALSPEAYNEYIKDYEKALYSSYQETLTDELDFAISKVGSLKTLLQSHFDITNAISDAQYQINKELAASKTMYEYLDEDTRKLLFNQEDYNALSQELVSIQNEANALQEQYNREISTATSENLDEITAKYEMQYETLMKSYEIKKAELEVIKKQQQLDNVLNERNVRMLINGRWEWVANTQDVINAQNELADAQHAKEQAVTSSAQTAELNELTLAENTLSTTIKNVENGIVDFDEQVGDISEILNGIEVSQLPALRGILDGVGSSLFNFVRQITDAKIETPISYSKNLDYSTEMQNSAYTPTGKGYLNSDRNWKTTSEGLGYETFDSIDTSHYDPVGDAYKSNDYHQGILNALAVGDIEGAKRANEIRNEKIDYLGLSETKWTDDDIREMAKNHHADGTRYTQGGLTLMGEVDPEMYITNNGHLIPINQPTIGNLGAGGIVFNQDQMANLRSMWDLSNIGTSVLSNVVSNNKSGDNVINYILNGGVHIDECNSADDLLNAIADRFRVKQ